MFIVLYFTHKRDVLKEKKKKKLRKKQAIIFASNS